MFESTFGLYNRNCKIIFLLDKFNVTNPIVSLKHTQDYVHAQKIDVVP
jgi:hypothetical protein